MLQWQIDHEINWYDLVDLYYSQGSGGSKGGRASLTPPPSASKFFQFHAVFGRIWQNCVFTPPLGGFTPPPPLGKSWIRHCKAICNGDKMC